MTNAEKILSRLDEKLDSEIDLTLYGRAALHLGFKDAVDEHALSRDVDAVFWVGQAEALNEQTNFWVAIEEINREFAEQGLYISHFFTEDQVILQPDWRENRVKIDGAWSNLQLHRLGDLDLLLSKLMRDEPVDRADAQFIVRSGGLARAEVERALSRARVPDVAEIREQFKLASGKLLASLPDSPCRQ